MLLLNGSDHWNFVNYQKKKKNPQQPKNPGLKPSRYLFNSIFSVCTEYFKHYVSKDSHINLTL